MTDPDTADPDSHPDPGTRPATAPVASSTLDDPDTEEWGTYRIFDAAGGGITMEVVMPETDYGDHLYEFEASDDEEADRVFSAFRAGLDCHAEARDEGILLPPSGFTPFWVFSGALWISFSIIALSFAWYCVRILVLPGSGALLGG